MQAQTLNRIGTWMASLTMAMAAFDVMEVNLDLAAARHAPAAADQASPHQSSPGPAELAALSGAPVASIDGGAGLHPRVESDPEDSQPLARPSSVRLADYTFD